MELCFRSLKKTDWAPYGTAAQGALVLVVAIVEIFWQRCLPLHHKCEFKSLNKSYTHVRSH